MSNGETTRQGGNPERPGRSDLGDRLLRFAADVVKTTEKIPRTLGGAHVARQLLASGTSVGANYEEAQAAESRADFIHKLQIALKEMRESHYWLRLIAAAQVLRRNGLGPLLDEATQLRAILSKAAITAKSRRTNPRPSRDDLMA
ncbi:MAG: four helix bundle protein [Planctomycetes bacterium]|nr:four helix bundle protein [Planctomycetota bacterium]